MYPLHRARHLCRAPKAAVADELNIYAMVLDFVPALISFFIVRDWVGKMAGGEAGRSLIAQQQLINCSRGDGAN